jgi:hypothetical protein
MDPHFSFLYDLLKDIYSDYDNYIFKTTSAILVIIGWLLTSKDARAFIAAHRCVVIPMMAAILFFIGAEIRFSESFYESSKNVESLIQAAIHDSNDPQIKEGYYERWVVSKTWIFVIAHIILYGILAWILCSIKPNEKQTEK